MKSAPFENLEGEESMRKTGITFLAVLVLLSSAYLAEAANPKWVTDTGNGYPSAVVNSLFPFDLTVKAKATGLANTTNYSWSIGPKTGNPPTLNIGCRTNSGNFPNGTNKVAGNIYSVSGSGNSTSNGNYIISTGPIAPTSSNYPSCGTGQTLAVKSVSGMVTITMVPLSPLDIPLSKK